VGWRLTLGTGIADRVNNLSTVSNPFDTSIVTQASTAQLDKDGITVTTIAGAVTITLTQDQAALAHQSTALWTQGARPPLRSMVRTPCTGLAPFAALSIT
jgi:hypothetical protein